MRWELEYSDKIDFFTMLNRQGRPTPLDSRVELSDSEYWFFKTYIKLCHYISGPPEFKDIVDMTNVVDMICTKEYFCDVLTCLSNEHKEYLSGIRSQNQAKS